MKRKGFTLHFLVAMTVVISIFITLVVSSITSYESNKQALVTNTLELNRINAEKIADTTNELLVNAQNTLASAASNIATTFSYDNNVKMLQLIKDSSQFFNVVFIADETGTVREVFPNTSELLGETLQSDIVKLSLHQQQPLISEPYIGVSGRYLVLVTQPIFDEKGVFRGLLAGSIYLSESNVFEVLLNSPMSFHSGSYFYVVSKQGYILFHPNKERIGESVIENAVVQTVLNGEQGERVIINRVGKRMLTGFAPIEQVDWGIVSQTPYTNITESSNKLVWNVITVSVPIIIILLCFVLLFTKFISNPLYKLANFSAEITNDSERDLQVPRIHSWNYEANQLKKTIEKMVLSMQQQIDILSDQASKDTLTGLYNRRSMDRVLQDWEKRELMYSYIILDIDHFKQVNDTFGHHMGDEVLQFLAIKLKEYAGVDNICCRYGGEEFVILSPGREPEEAYALAELIRTNIASSITPIGKPITISIGIAGSMNKQAVELTKQQADAALYISKQNGRNRTTVSYQEQYS
ncbi:diguanylate cyclase [Paenibacillus yanchengensis]|uniref:Diguanylate cyclase n=1 Tax=Paenibacillus yanchengensis TaxID=2035833 RepID=A0ABW4YJ51_9BACL